jgi:DNA-binding transcriptional ArsR family regulator
MTAYTQKTRNHSRAKGSTEAEAYPVRLERATRGLLALNVSALEHMEDSVGLEPLRALQSLDRRGPSMVGELGDDLGLVPSTASRLSDRLAEAGLITRRPARATGDPPCWNSPTPAAPYSTNWSRYASARSARSPTR